MVRAALLLGWLLLLLAALVAASMAWALDGGPGVTDFVKNGDFEDGVSDWEWVGGNLTTEDDPYADDTVGALTVTSPVAFVYQTFDVIPGGSYQLSGEFVDAQGNIDFAQLNLWPYDENGDPLPLEDADPRTTPGTWSSEVFTLPCEAASADIEVAIGGTFGSVAYLDDLRLKGAPPATPCPAPTSTATTTPSLTATAPPSTTPPAGPTATPTPSATSTPGVPPTPTVPPTPSHGLLINGGFEAASDGAPLGWDTKGGLLSQTEEPVHEGEFAGAFFSATESTKWVYQTVAVEPTAWYELDAYVFQDDPWVDSVLLRISWYASPDGSGSAVATVDSLSQLDEPQDGYRRLTTGPVKAPPGVQSARVRVLLRPVSDVSALIYVDDVTFRPSAPPPVPTPTPSPTFTPTSTPTPTRTPSATPTPPAGATSVPRETATSQPSATQPPALPSPTAPPGQATPSHGLLVNGSFEAVEEGQLVGWRKHG
ncbi:MAG: hypothetical protein U1B78_08115, partial [Dehalococcoidia bacterium]|nr:hypothetical protein [Dehalococcoidia bacterium]